jgi:large subunit ribosomal protein L4
MSPKAKILKASGSSSGSYDLPDELFSGEVNVPVMHQVVTAQLVEARSGSASTKTRSEVRGGGTKPWRQKGTGRARHGSIRSPIWVGGGVTFGPTGRNYSKRVNKKMRRSALRSALTDKAENGRVWVLDGFDEPRTKAAADFLQTADITGKTLLVLDPEDEGAMTIDRAFRNIDAVAFALYGSISTYDVLVADDVIFTKSAVDRLVSSRVGEASQ